MSRGYPGASATMKRLGVEVDTSRRKIDLLGVYVDAITQDELFDYVSEVIRRSEKAIVANHNLHSIYLYHKRPRMREFYARAGLVHIDGMPIVYWGRLRGLPLKLEHRLAYIDFVPPLLSLAATKGWRVYYLGGKPGVAERAADGFRGRFPDLIIRTHDGYFDNDSDVIADIRAFGPDLLFVGMGMPRQEEWIVDNLGRLQAHVIMNCGAAFDYFAGEKPTPPRWLSGMGLEWAFRLLTEPRRLARRYLVEPWLMLPIFLRDLRSRRRGG